MHSSFSTKVAKTIIRLLKPYMNIESKPVPNLAIGDIFAEAWALVKGTKLSFFIALVITVVVIGIVNGFFRKNFGIGGVGDLFARLFGNFVSVFFSTSLIAMGVKRARGESIT